jgi:hypothetical protein
MIIAKEITIRISIFNEGRAILQMIKRIGCEYYIVKGITFNDVGFDEVIKMSTLQVGEMITNIAHMYSKTILVPYIHMNMFEPDMFKVMCECHGLDVDYFELIMKHMTLKDIEQYEAHIGLIKMWMKLR